MDSETGAATTAPLTALEKMKAAKEKAKDKGYVDFTLDDCGVVVSMPAWRANADWMKAQALAGDDRAKLNHIWAAMICKFDGEKLTHDDLRENLSAADQIQLTNKLYANAPKN